MLWSIDNMIATPFCSSLCCTDILLLCMYIMNVVGVNLTIKLCLFTLRYESLSILVMNMIVASWSESWCFLIPRQHKLRGHIPSSTALGLVTANGIKKRQRGSVVLKSCYARVSLPWLCSNIKFCYTRTCAFAWKTVSIVAHIPCEAKKGGGRHESTY